MKAFSRAFMVAEHDPRRHRVSWIDERGHLLREFAVEYPLDLELQANGHLLLSSNLAIIELDRDFREIWRFATESPALFSCQRLSNGHILCGDTSRARICEIDGEGRVVRAMLFPYAADYQPFYDMFRLVRSIPGDRLLVACHHDQKVAEFSWSGDVLWQAALEGPPYHPLRLANGHTLISLGPTGLIVELNPDGKTVWRYDMVADSGLECGWIAGMTRLPDGNLIYSDSRHDRLVEISRRGEVVSIFQDRTVLLHPSTHVIL